MKKMKIKMSLSMVRKQIMRSGIEIFKEERLQMARERRLLRFSVTLSTFMTTAQSTRMAKIQSK
jgi:hypothetical protein